jgi:hypothetical protein
LGQNWFEFDFQKPFAERRKEIKMKKKRKGPQPSLSSP